MVISNAVHNGAMVLFHQDANERCLEPNIKSMGSVGIGFKMDTSCILEKMEPMTPVSAFARLGLKSFAKTRKLMFYP